MSITAKVYVTNYFGAASPLGFVDAEIGMITQHGHIMEIDGQIITIGSGTAEPQVKMEDDNVFIQKAHAQALWSWPTGVKCFPAGSNTLYPTSTSKSRNSGTIMIGSNGPVTYYR